jgi:outer membrane protein
VVEVGVGVVRAPRPYVGADAEIFPGPIANVQWGRLRVFGVDVGVELWTDGEWRVEAGLRPRFDGFEAGDSAFLRGMDEREMTLEGGARVSWSTPRTSVSLSAYTDLLGRHDGQELDLELSFRRRWRDLVYVPSVSATWVSSDVVSYYYGVRANEVRSFRPRYGGEDTVTIGAGVFGSYPIAERWRLLGLVQLERLGSEIENSPIVDERTQIFAFVGAAWRWI